MCADAKYSHSSDVAQHDLRGYREILPKYTHCFVTTMLHERKQRNPGSRDRRTARNIVMATFSAAAA